eukprot:3075192-Rhodomonas_salina.3
MKKGVPDRMIVLRQTQTAPPNVANGVSNVSGACVWSTLVRSDSSLYQSLNELPVGRLSRDAETVATVTAGRKLNLEKGNRKKEEKKEKKKKKSARLRCPRSLRRRRPGLPVLKANWVTYFDSECTLARALALALRASSSTWSSSYPGPSLSTTVTQY